MEKSASASRGEVNYEGLEVAFSDWRFSLLVRRFHNGEMIRTYSNTAITFNKPAHFLSMIAGIKSPTMRRTNDRCSRISGKYNAGLNWISRFKIAGNMIGAWPKIIENTKPIKILCSMAS